MAKSTGLAMSVLLDDSAGTPRTISNDVTSIQYATPMGVQAITGVDKSAMERQLLLADYSGSLSGVWNPTATTSSHAVFSTIATTRVNRTLAMATSSTPTATITAEVLLTDYQLNRDDDGKLLWSAPFFLADGTPAAWT